MIQLARPARSQAMQRPQYRAQAPAMQQQPSFEERLKQAAIEKAMKKGEEKLLEKAGAKSIGAAGAAMGDPTGGVATEMAAEAAMPALRSLLGGLFNKGGYVNGPLSLDSGGSIPVPISPREALNRAYHKELADPFSRAIFIDDKAARKRKMDFEDTILGKIFGGGSGIDVAGRQQLQSFAKEQVMKDNPELYQRVSKARYKVDGGKVKEEIEINYGGPLSNKGG